MDIAKRREEIDLAIEECAAGLEDADWLKRTLISLGVVIADKDAELPQRTWLFTDRLTSRPETVDEYKERLKGYTKTHSLLEER